MNLPSEAQCLDWFKEFKVPKNILEHCLKVREVALVLGKKIQEKGYSLNLELVDRMALLHDLFKMVSVNLKEHNQHHNYVFSEEELNARKELIKKYPDMHEGEIAFAFLQEKYPSFALSLKHASGFTEIKRNWEELIVHYADWRILQNKVVTLPERINYLEEIYHPDGKSWEEHKKIIFDSEEKLSKALCTSSEHLLMEMNH